MTAVQHRGVSSWHICDEDCPIPGPLHRGPMVELFGLTRAPADCTWRPER